MKLDQYKDIYNKVKTDPLMDKRLKDSLIYYDTEKAEEKQKQYNSSSKKSNIRSFLRPMKKLTLLRASLPSLVFLVFMVVIILSIKARMAGSPSTDGNDSELLAASTEQAQDNDDLIEKLKGKYQTERTAPSKAPAEAISVAPTKAVEFVEEDSPAAITAAPAEEAERFAEGNSNPLNGMEIPLVSGYPSGMIEIPVDAEATPIEIPVDAEAAPIVLEQPAVTVVLTQAPVEPAESIDAALSTGQFYFAYFDVATERNVKAVIPNLIVRLHGTVDSIDPSDLTEVVLTLDGAPVENGITLTDKIDQFEWSFEDITDFYFRFDYENRQPGIYGLTGKYKGEPFTVYNKIIEAGVTDEPADPEALQYVTWGFYPDKNDKPQRISELVFDFSGVQNSFYQADLSELRVTRDGTEIACTFLSGATRYLEYTYDNKSDTSFNMILTEPFTQSGTYIITGKYRGKDFTSQEIIIP